MSRTSKALKRFGVPGLAALTIFAGIPAFVSTSASAATGDTITMTPDTDSASAGTCNPFTVTTKNSSGGIATGTVDVIVTQRNNGTAAITGDTFDVTFCTTNTAGPNATPTDQTSSGTPAGPPNNDTDARHAEFTPDPATGVFTFGIVGTEAGVADVLAFIDNSGDNDTLDAGDPRDTSVKTFTAGTAADVKTITATPKTATNFVGETHTIKALLKNAAGDTVAGITPSSDITSGPNAATNPNCLPSDNDGVASCSYTGNAVGTDSIVIFINQTNADNNPATPDSTGPDAGEPQDTVQKTWATAPTGLTIDTTCGDATTARSGPEDCFNQLSDKTEDFSALVKKADGSVAAGALVTFAITNNNPATNSTTNQPATLSATEATTDASGIAKVTLTNPQTSDGEVITVTATVRGQTPTTSDDARKTWRTATSATDGGQRNIVLTPETATTSVGTFRTFTAHVTNVNGEPVQGVSVQFDENGAGAFRNGNSQTIVTTDINGNATVDVTAGVNETGTQTITATITGGSCASPAGTPAGATAGNCTDTSTNTFVTGTPSPTTSPTQGGRGTLSTSTPDIQPNIQGVLTATGLTSSAVYELRCYSRPSTTYFTARTASTSAGGTTLEFRILPGTNTRCYVRPQGNEALASNSVVINVHTSLSLSAYRDGVRRYHFQGTNLPRRAGQLITLYRWARADNNGFCDPHIAAGDYNAKSSDPNCVAIRTATAFTNSSNVWRIDRTFTGSGQFVFQVRSGQNLTNAAGVSNARLTIIH